MKLYKILILALFTTALISCGGAEERKAVYLEKARVSFEAGDLDKARIELKNVLQIDPKDSKAYFQLGKVHEQLKDYRKAYASYLKSEELDPGNLENQAKLGRIYLLLANDSEKAQQKIDLILAKEPDNSEGLLLKAAMMLKNKDRDGAIRIAKEIVFKNPDHVEGASFLATLYIGEKKNKAALDVLNNALKTNKDNESLNRLLAFSLIKNKDYDRAEIIYKNFLKRNPDSGASYNNLAIFYNTIGNTAKAEETLRASMDNDPSDIDRKLLLVKYIKDIKGNDEAIKLLKSLIAEDSSIGKLRSALAEVYILNNDQQSAIDVYKGAINDFSEELTGVEARISLASIYLSEKSVVKAKAIVDEALGISPNDPKLNFLRAKIALFDKDVEKAIISLRVVTKQTPENIYAYILLANAYQLENNIEQVKNTFTSAYDNNRMNPDALLKLAEYLIKRDMNFSEKIIDDYNNIKGADYNGMAIKAAILNQKKKQPEAYAIAMKMIDLYSDKPAGYFQSIPYLIQQGDKKKAISILEKGYMNTKSNRMLLETLSTLQVSEKQFGVVVKRIKAELNASPDDVDLKILLSKVYIASKDIKSAMALLNEIIDTKPGVEESYLLLSQIYQNNKDLKSVKSTLIKGKNNVATSFKISFRLASIYELEQDYTGAISVYRELYNSHPDNLIVINNLASMLSDYSDIRDDLEFAKTLVEKLKRGKQPVFLDTTGWVYFKIGDYEDAIRYLTQAVTYSPKISVFNYHLGMAYKMSGNKEQARTYLEKSVVDGKDFKEKKQAKAALKDL